MKCKYVDVKYIVQNKRTTCILTIDFIDEGEVVASEEFKGVAVCLDEDDFDFEIGKRIALAKAENKLYIYVRKRMNKIIDFLNKRLTNYSNFLNFATDQITHNTKYLEEQRYLNYKKD